MLVFSDTSSGPAAVALTSSTEIASILSQLGLSIRGLSLKLRPVHILGCCSLHCYSFLVILWKNSSNRMFSTWFCRIWNLKSQKFSCLARLLTSLAYTSVFFSVLHRCVSGYSDFTFYYTSLLTQPIWATDELITEGQDLGEGQFIPRSSERLLKQKSFAIQQSCLRRFIIYNFWCRQLYLGRSCRNSGK